MIAAESPDGLYHYGISYSAQTWAGGSGRGHAILATSNPILYSPTDNSQQADIAEAIRADFPPGRSITGVTIIGITVLAVPRPRPWWWRIISKDSS